MENGTLEDGRGTPEERRQGAGGIAGLRVKEWPKAWARPNAAPSSAGYSDPWKIRALVEHARRGHIGAQEELRWLHRPKMIRVVSSMLGPGDRWQRDARDLADQLLSRGLAELSELDIRGAASLWPFLRARAREALVQRFRDGAERPAGKEARDGEPRGSAHWPSEERPDLEKELDRDAFDRWMRIAVGERVRRAILMRLDLGLELDEVAREGGFASARKARSEIIVGLMKTVHAMARRCPRDARRWVLERSVTAIVDNPGPRAIDDLLASHHLQPTRGAWSEENWWATVPLLMSRRFGELIRRVAR